MTSRPTCPAPPVGVIVDVLVIVGAPAIVVVGGGRSVAEDEDAGMFGYAGVLQCALGSARRPVCGASSKVIRISPSALTSS
jgi:hypothetical protein